MKQTIDVHTTPDAREYQKIQEFLFAASGISLGAGKEAMVAGRLGKRLRALNIRNYLEYLHFLLREPQERQLAIDLLTTNETYFFREPKHFSFFAEVAIAEWNNLNKPRIWSAASSSGEEAYSIAMVLAERRGQRPWEVFASDLSQSILATARAGVYSMQRTEKIPRPYLQRFCLKGVGSKEGTFQIDAALRQRVQFQQINLNTPLPDVGSFDMIWLRNVLIYFDLETKVRICQQIMQKLRPGGYFLVGHSESLQGLVPGLDLVQAAIYRKR
ncbi:protein-glutamate O-methyltransferase CheR [Acidithiobacillus sp.]|uniref:CheR family methyltransferase n=1 Tax=Acidithiobacillus sp. TaxID=1872118 RepID=UPI0032AF0F25|nr:protein-glutamate O-methyltransferase CheR [Gammaproteobacteria bacterium]